MNTVTVQQLAWYGEKETNLTFPQNWRVEICNMAGYNRPKLDSREILEAIANPIGRPPLREYALGKKEVVIIFDDMTRVTRVAEIAPHVLNELAAAGIRDSQIRFIAANGCHGAMDRVDFVKKLGEDVLARFPVYNHSPFTNCVYVGTTRRGTRVNINAEVMKCDLKIGIGSIVPHSMAGYGGGGKMILPGVAAYETIVAMHTPEKSVQDTVTGMGAIADNPRRQDIEEAVKMAGLDMKIDAIINGRGETAAIFAGEPSLAYASALAEAKKHYLTPVAREKDIVIANTFAKASEAITGLLIAFPSVSRDGGDIVLIANAPEGQATHYLMGPWGNSLGGELQLQMKLPRNVNRLIIFTEYPDLSSRNYLEDSEKVVMVNSWDRVLELLVKSHRHAAKVVVYPDSDIQYGAA
jgi:lactate racemase